MPARCMLAIMAAPAQEGEGTTRRNVFSSRPHQKRREPANGTVLPSPAPELVAHLCDQVATAVDRTGHPEEAVNQPFVVGRLHVHPGLLQLLSIGHAFAAQRI